MAPAPLLGHIPYTWDMDPVLFLGYASCTLWDPVAPGLGRYLLYIVLSHEFSDLSACQARVIMGAFPLPPPPAHHLPEKSLSCLLLPPVSMTGIVTMHGTGGSWLCAYCQLSLRRWARIASTVGPDVSSSSLACWSLRPLSSSWKAESLSGSLCKPHTEVSERGE